MAFQKGPGEGYGAAKQEALAHGDDLRCVALYWSGRIDGYAVEDRAGRCIGTGRLARDAWAAALARLQSQAMS